MTDTSGSPRGMASPPVASSPKNAASPGKTTSPASPRSPADAAPPTNTGALEAEEDGDEDTDRDSTFSEFDASDTTSLRSSLLRFREENGRTYQVYREGLYYMPNDEREHERLDLQHHLALAIQDGRLFISPAGKDKPLGRVLEGGCGTGVWCMEFADEHPETAVVGVDLCPSPPNFVAPNAHFYVDDLEDDWNYHQPFDFIYLRYMNGSIRDWPRLIRQAYQHLAPGGWIEMHDTVNPLVCDDGTFPEDSALYQWSQLLQEAAVKFGSPLDVARSFKQQLIDAGFRNVVQVEYKWPVNPWPKDRKWKEIGMWAERNLLDGLQGASLALFTKILGWSAIQLEAFLVQVRKDIQNRNIHAYFPVIVVYGQKPE